MAAVPSRPRQIIKSKLLIDFQRLPEFGHTFQVHFTVTLLFCECQASFDQVAPQSPAPCFRQQVHLNEFAGVRVQPFRRIDPSPTDDLAVENGDEIDGTFPLENVIQLIGAVIVIHRAGMVVPESAQGILDDVGEERIVAGFNMSDPEVQWSKYKSKPDGAQASTAATS